MFASIFNAYQCAPILCCITTDLGIFSTVLGNFGAEFVRALMPCNLLWLNAVKGQGVKSCSVAAKPFLQAGQVTQNWNSHIFHGLLVMSIFSEYTSCFILWTMMETGNYILTFERNVASCSKSPYITLFSVGLNQGCCRLDLRPFEIHIYWVFQIC